MTQQGQGEDRFLGAMVQNITGGIWTEYDSQQVSMRFGNLYNSGYNTNTSMVLRGDGTSVAW